MRSEMCDISSRIPSLVEGIKKRTSKFNTDLFIPNGKIVTLNESALNIINLINGERSVNDIYTILIKEYNENSDTIKNDVNFILETLLKLGYLTFDK